jgi:transposase
MQQLKRADDHKVISGILFVLITGCRWGDMPIIYVSECVGKSFKRCFKIGSRVIFVQSEQESYTLYPKIG